MIETLGFHEAIDNNYNNNDNDDKDDDNNKDDNDSKGNSARGLDIAQLFQMAYEVKCAYSSSDFFPVNT